MGYPHLDPSEPISPLLGAGNPNRMGEWLAGHFGVQKGIPPFRPSKWTPPARTPNGVLADGDAHAHALLMVLVILAVSPFRGMHAVIHTITYAYPSAYLYLGV